eukprot:TRINITY_DN15930_c0_g1_i2.p1 TRINITY_DN15930_c0_g1~~TRINITY_DN15930_c0_g1_i2.p1  ORF type:complete len:358 (-),score=56.34 TRINITY_DN15930_c0_g1_i2:14-1087(-)
MRRLQKSDKVIPLLVQLDDGLDMLPKEIADELIGSLRNSHAASGNPGSNGDDASGTDPVSGGSWLSVFTSSPLVAGIVHQVAGLPLEVVPHRCEQRRSETTYRLEEASVSNKLLLLRSDMWVQSLHGTSFLTMLKHLQAENEEFFKQHFELNVMWADQNAIAGEDMQNFWPLAAREFKAALFMPDDLVKMIFYETYASAMPIFAPSDGHLTRMLQRQDYYHFNSRHRYVTAQWADRSLVPFEPFQNDGRNQSSSVESQQEAPVNLHVTDSDDNAGKIGPAAMGLEQARYWASLTDVSNYPLVQHFDSIPALIVGFSTFNAAEVSQMMFQFHDKIRSKNEKFYRRVLGHSLSDSLKEG